MWTSSPALSLPALTPLPWWSCVFPSEPAPKSHTDGSEGTTAREEEREREEGRQTERSNRGLLSVRANPSKPPPPRHPDPPTPHKTLTGRVRLTVGSPSLFAGPRHPFTLELDTLDTTTPSDSALPLTPVPLCCWGRGGQRV